MKHVLQISQGRLKGVQLDLKDGKTILGRDESCGLMVDHSSVSREHAAFIRTGDSVSIRDLGSLNQVHVNRTPVSKRVLQDGDHVMIGQVEFQYFMTVEGAGPVFDPHKRLWSLIDVGALTGVGILFAVQFTFLIVLAIYWSPRSAMALLEKESEQVTDLVAVVEGSAAPVTLVVDVTPTEGVVQAEPPAEDEAFKEEDLLGKSRAELMLEKALVLRDEKRILGEAEQQLKRIQQMDSSFLGAYVELAKLYELRGAEKLAKEQWEEVVTRGKNTPLYEQASEALRKIERNEKMLAYARNFSRQSPPVPTDKPRAFRPTLKRPTPVSSLPPRIRVAGVDVKRYPASDTYDEMRLLSVSLGVEVFSKGTRLRGADVRVRVKFYDQDQNSLRLLPSEVLIAQPEVSLEGRVGSSDAPVVTFSYVVQRGYRAVEKKRLGKTLAYYGYIVEVFYKGKRVDRWVMPSTLKKFNR